MSNGTDVGQIFQMKKLSRYAPDVSNEIFLCDG